MSPNQQIISSAFAKAVNTDNKEEMRKWHNFWLYFGGVESSLYAAALESAMNPILYKERFFV